MKSLRASTRYAKALLDLSREREMMDVVKTDSDLLLAAIGESRDFRNFLKSAILKPEQKEKTLSNDLALIKQKQLLISITPKDFSFIAEENLAVIFNILSLEQIKINLMQNSALSFSILVDENQEQLTRLLSHLAKDYLHY